MPGNKRLKKPPRYGQGVGFMGG